MKTILKTLITFFDHQIITSHDTVCTQCEINLQNMANVSSASTTGLHSFQVNIRTCAEYGYIQVVFWCRIPENYDFLDQNTAEWCHFSFYLCARLTDEQAYWLFIHILEM